MSTFAAAHADKLAKIDENCESLYKHVDIYQKMSLELDEFLQMGNGVENATLKFDSLKINELTLTGADNEKRRTVEADLASAMQLFNDETNVVSGMFNENCDMKIITKQLRQTRRSLEEQLRKVNKGMQDLNCSLVGNADVKEMYKFDNPSAADYKTFHTITLESSTKSPLKIQLDSWRSGNTYSHSIHKMSKGGQRLRCSIEPYGDELIGINGRYVNVLNRMEMKLVLKWVEIELPKKSTEWEAISTGKVVLEVARQRKFDKIDWKEYEKKFMDKSYLKDGKSKKAKKTANSINKKDLTESKSEAKIEVPLLEVKEEVVTETATTREDKAKETITSKAEMKLSSESAESALMVTETAAVGEPVKKSTQDTDIAVPKNTSISQKLVDGFNSQVTWIEMLLVFGILLITVLFVIHNN